jgi:hypothetical protein
MVKAGIIAAVITAVTVVILSSDKPPISVDVVPRIAGGPTTIRITVRAEPKDTNRGLSVVIDSANYYRSSFDPDFVGADSPAIRNYTYELPYSGRYSVTAVLHRADPDKNTSAATEICIAGPETEC